jgi:hypothetical protein
MRSVSKEAHTQKSLGDGNHAKGENHRVGKPTRLLFLRLASQRMLRSQETAAFMFLSPQRYIPLKGYLRRFLGITT